MGERRDVVIVGAGPAGSAMAARLAAEGLDVLLLDRDAFPRPKPCGECLNPAAVEALERLGAGDRLRLLPTSRLQGWRIAARPGNSFEADFPHPYVGLGVARAELDLQLLELARERGAEVRERTRVADLLRNGDGVAGVTLANGEDIEANLVIGADGLRSVVVRRAGLVRRRPRLVKIALTAHLSAETTRDRGELHAFSWGCVGLAPVGDGRLNATVVLAGPATRAAAGERRKAFHDAVRKAFPGNGMEQIDDVLATGPFDWPTRRVVGDGVLLVGDAAGYYDPFTGQGIYRALRAAELAAPVAAEALRAGDSSARGLLPYARAHRAAFAPGLRLQRLIEQVVARPAVLSYVARRLSARPELASRLVSVTGDLAPVRSLATLQAVRALLP